MTPPSRSPRSRNWLRWPATVLPALLLVATAGLAGAGRSSGPGPVVDITVTAVRAPAP